MWTKLDDGFPDHPKVIACGPLAAWLYVAGLCYTNRLLTDGFIPVRQVLRLADVDDAVQLAERLCEVGLWEHAEGGYLVHDFHDLNPTAEEVKAHRADVSAKRAEAGKRGADARWQNGKMNSKSIATGMANVNGKTMAPPRPDPIPDPDLDSDLSTQKEKEDLTHNIRAADADASDAGDNFSLFFENDVWQVYPQRNGKRIGKKETAALVKKIPSREWENVALAVKHYAESSVAVRGYARDPIRFFRQDYWREWITPEQETRSNGNGAYQPNGAASANQNGAGGGKWSSRAGLADALAQRAQSTSRPEHH